MPKIAIAPPLEHNCNSWVVTRINDDTVIGEFFEHSSVERFDGDKVKVETTLSFLKRINNLIAPRLHKSCSESPDTSQPDLIATKPMSISSFTAEDGESYLRATGELTLYVTDALRS